ncbi:MAG: creatininase family protein [Rhodobacteraceae bacterium]|nr:creatininase family protein [Paracoccaceae bacterium]
MKLDHMTWPEVEAYLTRSAGIILPVGSTEQHGPMGLIGTDSLCAEAIADSAAELAGSIVAPALRYTPAAFNMGFPGTISIPESLFEAIFTEVLGSLAHHGFTKIYVLNAHGANIAPMRRSADALGESRVRIRSWWDFDAVNLLRQEFYGGWEGMHATPSEISITQALYRSVAPGVAAAPPRRLEPDEMKARAGDNHGSPDRHKAEFPDGRVGSHSALAKGEHGHALLGAAARAVCDDYRAFLAG